jgi:hypothetical protein
MVKKFFAGEEKTSAKRLNALMLLHYKQWGVKIQEIFYGYWRSGRFKRRLFDHLLQLVKQRGVKKAPHADPQPVAELLYGYHAGVFALRVEHAVYGGRRHARNIRERVDRDIPLMTKLEDSFRHGCFCIHCNTSPAFDVSQSL